MSQTPRPHPQTSRHEAALSEALQECVVVDLETTGLDPATDRIIEVAILKVRNGAVASRFHSLVDPQRDIPAESTAVHGLRTQDLAGAPTFDAIAPRIRELLAGRTVVGHNVKFDLGFLKAEFERLGRAAGSGQQCSDNAAHLPPAPGSFDFSPAPALPTFAPECTPLCTAEIARELIPRSAVGRYTLVNVAEHCSVPSSPSHRALQDATTTFELAGKLHELAHRTGRA